MVEIINSSAIEQWSSGQKGYARGPGNVQKYLFKGDASSPDNYEFNLIRSESDARGSPHHRHNFDQFKFALTGPINYAPDQDIQKGQLGYFPEGTYYGPQKERKGTEYLVLQFGGASGFGFLPYSAWKRGYEELGKIGTFEKGGFTHVDAEGKHHTKDAWQALWEYHTNRSVIFPKPRIDRPIIMDPEAYHWVSVADQPGATVKHLGTFNERGTFCAIVRIAAGSSYRFESEPQTRLLYVLDGDGTVDSELLEKACAVRILKNGPAGVFKAKTDINILVLGLPRFGPGDGSVSVVKSLETVAA